MFKNLLSVESFAVVAYDDKHFAASFLASRVIVLTSGLPFKSDFFGSIP